MAAPCDLAGGADDLEGDEGAQRDETHVRDRRIRDQLLHVLLHQRDEADVDHGHERQRDDQPVEFTRWRPA